MKTRFLAPMLALPVLLFVFTAFPHTASAQFMNICQTYYDRNACGGEGCAVTDCSVNVAQSQVDAFMQNVIYADLASGYFLNPVYDGFGRLVGADCANGTTFTYSYDYAPAACNSPSNSCGDTNSGYLIAGVCTAGGAPAERANWNQSCSASNACGTNTGVYDCNSNCSASPPALPGNYGQGCTSAANACGQTNSGTIQCNGSCSASTPSNSSCPAPTVNNVTISSGSIIPDGSTTYVITVVGSDSVGGNDIGQLLALINYQGANAGSYRGYLNWNNQGWNWAAPTAAPIACTGGGVAQKYGDVSNNNAYGGPYMNLVSCTTSTSGNTRTSTFTVSFNPSYTTPATNNNISGYSQSATSPFSASGWINFNTNFSIVPPPAPTATINVSPTPIGGQGASYPFTVTWSSTNATSCSVNYRYYGGPYTDAVPSWISEFNATSGSQTDTDTLLPAQYRLLCTGPGGTATSYVTQTASSPSVSCSVSPTNGSTAATFTWTAVPSGGIAPYTYSWTGTAPLTSANSTSRSVTYPSTGSKTAAVTVTDSIGHSSGSVACSNSATVTTPLAATCSGTPSSGTVNLTSFTWTAAPTGGVAPYTYSWTGSAPLASANSISRAVVYTTTGSKTAAVTVSDSIGGNTGSITCVSPVTVNPAGLPDYQAAAAPTISGAAVTGTPVTFSGAVKNAGAVAGTSTSQIRFQVDPGLTGSAWSGAPTNLDTAVGIVPALASGATDSIRTSPSWTPPAAGNYKVRLCADLPGNTIGEGANEGNNCGAELQVVVTDPSITGSCGVSPTSGTTATTYTWSASGVSGGNGTYTYSWSGTDGLSGTTASLPTFYATAGSKTATLTVTSNGVSLPINCAADSNPADGTATVTSCVPTLSASPSTIVPGQTTTFTWNEPGVCAASCQFSDGHTAAISGNNYTVTPPTPGVGTTDTYSITCPNGTPANTANTTITFLLPTDSITATPKRVQLTAASTTIAWTASNVTSCSIAKNGSVWQASLPVVGGSVNGSQNDTITIPSTYVITCLATVAGVTATSTATTTTNTVPSFQSF